MKLKSIRSKIFLVLVPLLVTSSLLVSMTTMRKFRHVYQDITQQMTYLVGQEVLRTVQKNLNFFPLDGFEGVDTYLQGVLKGRDLLCYIYITDGRGKMLYQSNSSHGQTVSAEVLHQLPAAEQKTILTQSIYESLIPVVQGEKGAIGTIHIGANKQLVDARLADIDHQNKIILGITLLVSLGLFYVLSSGILVRPITGLLKDVKDIGSHRDLTRHVMVRGHDEIGQYAEAFNEMIDRLKVYYDQLEDRVQERTGELRQANDFLRSEITKREKTQQALQESRSMLQLVIDTIPPCVCWKNRSGVYLGCNQNYARFVGQARVENLLGRTEGTLEQMPWAVRLRAIEHDVMRRDQAVYHLVASYVGREGQELWLDHSVVPLHNQEGQVVGVLCAFDDITLRKKAETEQVHLEKELERSQRLESIGTLSSGIAHEINTPLQYISDNIAFLADAMKDFMELAHSYQSLLQECEQTGMTAIVEKRRASEEKADLPYLEKELPTAITQSQDGLDRVAGIVRAMKAFAHYNREKELADINKAIENTLTVSRNEWKYVAEVKMDFDLSLPSVNCYITDINQAVINLVVNAAHAIADVLGDEPDHKGVITVTTQLRDNTVVIKVGDTGKGIPEAIRDKIFLPFFTTKPVGKGSGQGLAIAYRSIVEKHGGKLDFESEVGKGTTFVMEIPFE